MDAMRLCLQRDPKLRPIIGVNGLLNEHCFYMARKKTQIKMNEDDGWDEKGIDFY